MDYNLLKLNGVFDRVGGIILGKHELFDNQGTGRTPSDILLETIGQPSIPILTEFDCCHTHPMLTMPIGRIGIGICFISTTGVLPINS